LGFGQVGEKNMAKTAKGPLTG